MSAHRRRTGDPPRVGFLPLEETDALWPGNPCLILVKPLPAAR